MTTDHPTILRLAATTPARDWARLRLTGRLDWRAAVADLPGPLADLVARVVRRSRLWRLEKADLARELSAHFADGLDAGRSPEDLAASFGDPRRAARLVRRAKRRARPLACRAFIHAFQGFGALLVGLALVYAVLAWRYHTGEPNIARNYTAEYNARIEQIPETDRAWDLYMEAYAESEPLPKVLKGSWPAPAPEHPAYAEALAYLGRQQDVIALLHRAAARPHLGAPLSDAIDPRMIEVSEARTGITDAPWPEPSENPMLMEVLLPELGHFREMARLLTFDAHAAAHAAEPGRALRDISSMLAIGEHAAERPMVIAGLVGVGIGALAARTTAEIVHEHPKLFSDEQLRALAHRHAALMGGEPRIDLSGERRFFEDLVQRIYTDDGNGDGRITAEGVQTLLSVSGTAGGRKPEFSPAPLAPVAAALVADRADMMAMYDRFWALILERAGRPMWEYESPNPVDQEIWRLREHPLDYVRYLPIVLLMPALDTTSLTAERIAQQRDALLVGLALELYHREHAAYPDSLGALVPAYLPAVPPDRFTGEPLRYALADGSPRLWSCGVDGDDDGGRPPAGSRDLSWRWLPEDQLRASLDARSGADNYDGDWVLWPIRYEPLARDAGEEP